MFGKTNPFEIFDPLCDVCNLDLIFGMYSCQLIFSTFNI